MGNHEQAQLPSLAGAFARFSRFRRRHGLLLPLAMAGMAFLGACSSVDRSRSLGDSNVSATTIAQQVCSNCHGVRGVSESPNFPHLAAQTPAYVDAQLKSFRVHGRLDPPGFEYMWGISSRLTDQQIAGLAAYFSTQPAPPAQRQDAELEKRGRAIFDNGIAARNIPACSSCHGAHGEGQGQFPRLAGQHADYVAKQLNVFQRTDQRPEGAIMKTVAHSLTAENIESIAAYVQSMPPVR
jgi:cytochrome c553